MELLKELFSITKDQSLVEAKGKKKKKDKRPFALGMVPLTSFVGNTVMSGEGDAMSEGKKNMTVKVDVPKPRGKQVNDVLRSRKGGRMKSDTDFDRNAVKRATKAALHENDGEEHYFWFAATEEVKNRGGGDGPEATDRRNTGVVKAPDKEAARAQAKRMYPRAYDIEVGTSSKEKYDREMGREWD